VAKPDHVPYSAPLFKRSLAIREKALGPEHPDVAQSLNNLAGVYRDQGHYGDAEPLYRRSLSLFAKALGPDHPSVASSLNNVVRLYRDQHRNAEALPLVRTAIDRKSAQIDAALPILFGTEASGLIPAKEAFDDSLNVVQRAANTSAADALNSLAVRFSAGNDRLAQLVRRDQDLTVEAGKLD
jgi:tetratricopeptide (TPR) repeat protein